MAEGPTFWKGAVMGGYEKNRFPTQTVGLVLDINYGEVLLPLCDRMPVWIVQSIANEAATEHVHKVRRLPQLWLTTFPLRKQETVAAACERIVCSLNQHHDQSSQEPPYNKLMVIGVTLSEVSLASFLECEFDSFFTTVDGFNAQKSTV
jgi:hypothetical protein